MTDPVERIHLLLVLQRHLGALWGVIVMGRKMRQHLDASAQVAALGAGLMPTPPVRPRSVEAEAPLRVRRRAE